MLRADCKVLSSLIALTIKDNFYVATLLIMTEVGILETLLVIFFKMFLHLFSIGHTDATACVPRDTDLAGVVSVLTLSVFQDFIQAFMSSKHLCLVDHLFVLP